MDLGLYAYITIAGIIITIVMIFALLKCYKKVPHQGMVYIVNQVKEVVVYFTGGWIFPLIHTAELMDISRKVITVKKKGEIDSNDEDSEGLLCKDNIRADIDVKFYIGVNRESEDILNVVKNLTVERAGNQEFVQKYFAPKFSEALKTAAKGLEFSELYTNRIGFRDSVSEIIGKDLDGFQLQDVVIDYLEQTSLDAHNKDNMMDVEGIEKITRITTQKNIATNILVQDEETQIKEKDVGAFNTRLQLDKQQGEAEEIQMRELRVIKAEQNAEATQAEEDSRLTRETAEIKTQEKVDIEQTKKDQEVEVAVIAKDRVTKIESEKVNRAEKTEIVQTEKEVSVLEMEKEKEVEIKKKEVAEVVAQRVVTEQKTAKAEEVTLNIRNEEEANRHKLAKVVAAEATAEASQVEKVKAAEASKKSATFKAEEIEIEANAQLLKDDKVSQGKVKLAEGVKAEASAEGLAKVEVEIAEADAITAKGDANAKAGIAEAGVIEAKGKAEAEAGIAEADSIAAKGVAEADSTEKMGIAKAKGAKAEYEAMESITPETRDQEIKKLEIDKETKVELAEVAASIDISANNSSVMGRAFESANMDFVGGAKDFIETIMATTANAKNFDRSVQESEVKTTLMSDYLDGERSLPEDITKILTENPNFGNLTVAQAMTNPDFMSKISSILPMLGNKQV
jgi:uncharacterized membrane protein YqiK